MVAHTFIAELARRKIVVDPTLVIFESQYTSDGGVPAPAYSSYMGLLSPSYDRFFKAGNYLRSALYGFFAMGWRGANRHWSNYEMAYLILAGVSTPLVLSVHTIVSFDFAVSQLPGWHTTIFPPYFVAGAIFSGFAMVMTLEMTGWRSV